jgi:hypothetical protein
MTGVNASTCTAVKPVAGRRSQGQRKFFSVAAPAAEPIRDGGVWRMWRSAPILPSLGPGMSPILPISFVVTLLCVLVAIDWALYQQILFVGAALSATVWACSLEAWSCQTPVMSEDERSHHHLADE